MRNLTEPLWNFSSAPCGRCLTRSLKLPRPAARVTPELWFFRGCRHFSRLLRPTRQLALFPVHASRGRSTGREAFHEATQNRATTRHFVCKNQLLLGERVENCAHGNALALPDGGNDQATQRGARTIPQRASNSKSLIGRSQ